MEAETQKLVNEKIRELIKSQDVNAIDRAIKLIKAINMSTK